MAYIMLRDVAELKLKQGEKLEHEFGKLPSALEFSAKWQEASEEDADAKAVSDADLKKELKAVKTELTKTKKLVEEKDEKIAELEKLLDDASKHAESGGDGEAKAE